MKSTRNYVIVVLALLCVATAALAWRQYEELIVLRAQIGVDDRAALLKRLADVQKQAKTLQDRLAAARAGRARRSDDPNNPDGRGGPNWRGGFRAVMNNPQFMQLMAIQQKSQLDGKYAALFKNLTQSGALTADQLAQFKDLLVQKQQAMMDTLQAARAQGVSPRTDPTAFNQAVTSAQAGVDQQIQSALGPTAYAEYQQYEQTLPQRNTVTAVQQALSYSQTPLTDDQANQLIQILAQDAPPSNGNGTDLRQILNNNATAAVTAQALNDASTVLQPGQVQALQEIQQTQQAQKQMQQLMRSTFSGAGTAASAPAPAAAPGG